MAFNRRAELELAASNRKLKADLRQAEQEIGAFGRSASGKLSGAFKAGLGGFAAFGAASGFADLGRDVISFEERLTRVGIQAGASDEELATLRQTIRQTAKELGMTTDEVLGASEALADLEGKAGIDATRMKVLAQAAKATGASMQDLAGLSFAFTSAFGEMDPKELEATFSAVTNIGKTMSVPLNEMSRGLQSVGATFANVVSDGRRGIIEMAAAQQIARKGFGSADQAATGMQAFASSLGTAAKRLKDLGIEVQEIGPNGEKGMRNFLTIIDDLNEKIGGDFVKLTETLGSVEAVKFAQVMMQNRAQVDGLVESALKANDVQEDLQKFLASNAGRLQQSLAQARVKLEELVTPERIERFVAVVEKLVTVTEFLIDNFGKLATIYGAAKVAQVASATSAWAAALGKVNSNASQVGGALSGAVGTTGKLASGTTQVGGALSGAVGTAGKLASGTTKLVSGFTQAASAAGGIAAALLGGYQLGTMLVEQLGLFKDETIAEATEDDPQAEAAKAREFLEQREQAIADLENRRGTLASLKYRKQRTGMGPEIDYDAEIAKTEEQLDYERQQRDREKSELIAQTVFQRNKARGTNATDDIIRDAEESARVAEALARVGSGFESQTTSTPVLQEFAPELSTVAPDVRKQVAASLQNLLAEDELTTRKRAALDAQVQGTQAIDDKRIAEAVQRGLQQANIKLTVGVDGRALFQTVRNQPDGHRSGAE